MTASPNRPHGAFPAHTAPGSLCLGSWAARAAYTRCSLQPAPDSQTLNDGNLCFYLLYNDQVLSYAYADMIMKRTTTVVLASDGTTESITTMDVPTNPPSYDLQALPSSYTRAGGIEYLYGNGNNTRTADVGYRRTVTLEDYNLRGTYQTIAALAGFIATLCGFPGLLSSAVRSNTITTILKIKAILKKRSRQAMLVCFLLAMDLQ